jgi:hypothetical protein
VPISMPGIDRSRLSTFLYLWQPDPGTPKRPLLRERHACPAGAPAGALEALARGWREDGRAQPTGAFCG